MNYTHNGHDDEMTLQLKILFGLIKITRKIPLLAIDDESASIVYEEVDQSALGTREKKGKFTVQQFLDDLKHLERFLKHVVGFHTIVRKFMKKVTLKDFKWSSTIGTGDAALTGSTSGLLWGIKGNTLGIIANYMNLKNEPAIYVNPDFQQMVLKTNFSCMISFRLGYAIFAGLKVIRHWKKGKALFNKDNSEQTARRDIHV